MEETIKYLLHKVTHLSHEGRLSTHVWPCDEDTRGMLLFFITFTATRAANVDVIRYEVITKKGLGDTGVAGSSEVKEGRYLVITFGQHHLWPGHRSISTLTVA